MAIGMAGVAKTGILGLDAMLNGGIPEKNQIVLAGGPGAGKTLLSFEFLYRNAKQGNNSVMFVVEEDAEKVLENAKGAFSGLKDIDDLVKSGALSIEGLSAVSNASESMRQSSYEFGNFVSDIEAIIADKKATRVVIDSTAVLEILVKDPLMFRKSMLALVVDLRRLGVTSILTAEMSSLEKQSLSFRPEFFLFDGIIMLYLSGEEEKRMQSMEIIKMRGSKHSFVTTPYDISPAGFKVFAAEEITQE